MKLINIVLSVVLVLSVNTYAVEEEEVNVNFRDLKVRDFIEMVSKITKKNMLIETELKGKINFISQTPIKKSGLISLANSILSSKGLTLVDKGDYFKVVKSANAAGEGLPVRSSISGSVMATVIFPLHNTNAAVVRAKIKPLLHKSAKVISFKENNVLSITAYPETLESIAKIIHAVEERGEKKSIIYELQHSTVKDVFSNAQNMAKKLFPQTIESEKVDIFKDESTNSIILVGKTDNANRMIKYIKQLDREGEDQSQKMYVLRLNNSNVEEMEKILSKLLSQMNSVAIKTSKKGGVPPSKAMVVSDVERNALILLATGEQIKNIRETVAKIDIPKSQVYVKAKIIEVDTNMAAQVGLKYGFEGGAITSTGLFSMGGNLGGQALNMSAELLGFLNSSQTSTQLDNNGNSIQQTSPAFKIDSTDKVFALGAQLDLLQKNGAANLLSEPSVLCTNNKESSIYIGQTMSILAQGQQSTAGLSNIVNSYTREDIGLTLTVQPRLSSNNQVSLEILVEIEDLDPSSEQIADRPTTTKRTVKTNAIVRNGETIILGGLIKKVGGNGKVKIPYLSELPIIGDLLFTHNSDVEREQNVIIYLTPYIVRSSSDLQKLKSLLSELDDVQRQYNKIVGKNLEALDLKAFKSHNGSAAGRIRAVPQTKEQVQKVKVEEVKVTEVGSRGRIYHSKTSEDKVIQVESTNISSNDSIVNNHQALLFGDD
ncbi:MAG: type II secretion system secretin GspD [Sulfurovum sp.]|nr:type II secretion system secretin GspD [Sulfurovum sp.]